VSRVIREGDSKKVKRFGEYSSNKGQQTLSNMHNIETGLYCNASDNQGGICTKTLTIHIGSTFSKQPQVKEKKGGGGGGKR
jgi:hypothetical protein